jgi:hypothetical protein
MKQKQLDEKGFTGHQVGGIMAEFWQTGSKSGSFSP